MQAQAYEGYFENGQFYASGRAVAIPELKKVFITILDESISNNGNDKKSKNFFKEMDLEEIKAEDKELRIKWLEKLNTAIGLSMNEELPYIKRSTTMREPIGLSD